MAASSTSCSRARDEACGREVRRNSTGDASTAPQSRLSNRITYSPRFTLRPNASSDSRHGSQTRSAAHGLGCETLFADPSLADAPPEAEGGVDEVVNDVQLQRGAEAQLGRPAVDRLSHVVNRVRWSYGSTGFCAKPGLGGFTRRNENRLVLIAFIHDGAQLSL